MCWGPRSLYLLVSVELGGQLVSLPCRVLCTELRAAELACGPERGLAWPRTAPGPVPFPARPGPRPIPPPRGSRAHSPGGRGSRRPWLCGGSAAQTAAQVSLETPAGADQGQAQPEPPAKSGSGHGRPALCGEKGSRRWDARRGPVPSRPEERRCQPGPAAPRQKRPGGAALSPPLSRPGPAVLRCSRGAAPLPLPGSSQR